MVTRFYYWTIGLSIILISIPIIEYIASLRELKIKIASEKNG